MAVRPFRKVHDCRALFRYADEVCRQGMPTGYADRVCRQGMPTGCANRLSQRPYFGNMSRISMMLENIRFVYTKHHFSMFVRVLRGMPTTYADNLCRQPMPTPMPTTYADDLCRQPVPTPYANNLCRQPMPTGL